MTHAFSDLLHKSMLVFIDDFSTLTSKIDHMVMLKACFERCRHYGIALNPEKIYLAVERGVLLGHVVSKKGKEPDPEKIEVIVNLQPLNDVKGVQRVLGHFGWYRDIMHDYATAAIPLTNLTKKGTPYNWTLQCQEGFDALKANVATPLWPSVGVKPNTWKSWGFGVLRDSRMFKARQQGAKHLALGCSWCRWKGLET
jgi:hypothetical protein